MLCWRPVLRSYTIFSLFIVIDIKEFNPFLRWNPVLLVRADGGRSADALLKPNRCLESHLSSCLQVNPTDYISIWCWLTLVCDKVLLKFTFLQEINVEWRRVPKKWVANCIFPTRSRDTLLSWVPHRTASVFVFQSCYCKAYPIGFHCPNILIWPHWTP